MGSPCPASSGSFKKPCRSPAWGSRTPARDESCVRSPTRRGGVRCLGQDSTAIRVECTAPARPSWPGHAGENLGRRRDRLLLRVSALFAIRAMIPQVEDPHPRAAWFADERIVAAPPLGQFKSEEIRDVVPIVADEDARPAILGNGVTGSQGVRPSTCLESREALEFGLRQAFLLAIAFLRRTAPLLKDRGGFCGIIDTEKLWLGHADRLFAAEPSARRRGGADPEDLPARPLVVDHLVVGHVLETRV